MANYHIPRFTRSFLAPKYWGFWFVLGLFWLLIQLPYPLLRYIGSALGMLFAKLKIGQRRMKIARRNLELCFPEYSSQKIEQLVQENMRSVGMGLIETGMAWFWSDKRIKKWSKVTGLENLTQNKKDGVIFVGVHFLTLELGARIVGIHQPGIGVYRPNDNPIMDWIQCWGRSRSNRGLLDRKDLRGMIRALREGNIIWYAPDHDYGRKNAVFVPLFAVPEVATTTGTAYLLKASHESKVVPFAPLRNQDGSGYTVTISSAVDFSDIIGDDVAIATRMNKVVETEILMGVTQYMWLHRRFKTRPRENDPSFYS